MKKKTIFVLLLILAMTASVFTTACSKSSSKSKSGGNAAETRTLEQYAVKNPDVQKSINEATSESDVEVEIRGNDVIYSFELSKMEGYTEDVAKDPSVVESLQKALDNAGHTFGGIARTLEKATDIKGIRVVVNYTYDGEELATQTFDSSDAAAEDESKEGESEDNDSSEDTDSDSEGDSGEATAEDSAE